MLGRDARHRFHRRPGRNKKVKHLGLWYVKRKPRPVANGPLISDFPTYDEHPGPGTDEYIQDPQYPAEAYF